ncbi:MAG: sulfotransferase family protein [Actinomycetota bacterium]
MVGGGSAFRTVFLIGAPRSGTTWLQKLLGSHPRVATPQETEIFARYVAPLASRWEQQLREAPQMRYKGLPAIFTEDEFVDAIRRFIESAFSKVIQKKPGADVLLEKTPMHSLFVPLIVKYVPDARFIHLIRDGRAVADSLTRVSASWGSNWAPATIEDAARLWKEFTVSARSAASITDRYCEVRYEDLRKEGPSCLRRLFEYCSVDASVDDCQTIFEQSNGPGKATTSDRSQGIIRSGEILRRYGTDIEEPSGFVGSGGPSRYARWKPRDRWVFNKIAGGLLTELGYERNDEWKDIGRVRETYFGSVDGLHRARSRLSGLLFRRYP